MPVVCVSTPVNRAATSTYTAVYISDTSHAEPSRVSLTKSDNLAPMFQSYTDKVKPFSEKALSIVKPDLVHFRREVKLDNNQVDKDDSSTNEFNGKRPIHLHKPYPQNDSPYLEADSLPSKTVYGSSLNASPTTVTSSVVMENIPTTTITNPALDPMSKLEATLNPDLPVLNTIWTPAAVSTTSLSSLLQPTDSPAKSSHMYNSSTYQGMNSQEELVERIGVVGIIGLCLVGCAMMVAVSLGALFAYRSHRGKSTPSHGDPPNTLDGTPCIPPSYDTLTQKSLENSISPTTASCINSSQHHSNEEPAANPHELVPSTEHVLSQLESNLLITQTPPPTNAFLAQGLNSTYPTSPTTSPMSATIPSKLSNAQGVKAVIRPRTDFETSDMHIMSSSDMTLGNISIPDMPNTSCPGTCSNAMPENTFATKTSLAPQCFNSKPCKSYRPVQSTALHNITTKFNPSTNLVGVPLQPVLNSRHVQGTDNVVFRDPDGFFRVRSYSEKSIDSVATHGDTSSESYSPSALTRDSTKSYSGIYSVINVSRSTIGGSNATDGTSQRVSEYQFERSPLADTRKSVSSSSYQIVDSYML
ncbi:hypothetical protein BSLG_001801 [Batrachochytrium salamandrivorans]|nr:hypothetical protein BSLG_001801 [Batrachochytrium salamandrivorans]